MVKSQLKTRSRGVFIAVEGIDGSGKTSVSLKLQKFLESLGYRVMYTAEPSRGPIGDIIRERVFKPKVRPNPYLEALLFAADRIQHLEEEILPALQRGWVVVCDRYLYSSLAYQGARGVPSRWIRAINRFAKPPDITLYIDVPPEVGLSRKKEITTETFENIDYLRRVRRIYLGLVKRGEMELVEGSGSPDEVFERVIRVIRKYDFFPNV